MRPNDRAATLIAFPRVGRHRDGTEPGEVCPGAPTAREMELIGHVARGLQNKVIAHEMRISPNTVRAHIGNIMRKYGLRNRTQVAMLLVALRGAEALRGRVGAP